MHGSLRAPVSAALQVQSESRTAGWPLREIDGRVHRRRQIAHDRKAEAGASREVFQCPTKTYERFPHVVSLRERDTGTTVVDPKTYGALLVADANGDGLSDRPILRRVVEDVDQNLPDGTRISPGNGRLWYVEHDTHLPGFRQRSEEIRGSLGDMHHVDRSR